MTTTTDNNRLAGRIDGILVSTDKWLTPSEAARKAKCETYEARDALQALVRNGFAVTSGNGCWTKYHAK